MERQDIDAELATAGAQELLASTSMCHLAYVGKDGSPRVIPIGCFWTGEQVVISTAPSSPSGTGRNRPRIPSRPDVENRRPATSPVRTRPQWSRAERRPVMSASRLGTRRTAGHGAVDSELGRHGAVAGCR